MTSDKMFWVEIRRTAGVVLFCLPILCRWYDGGDLIVHLPIPDTRSDDLFGFHISQDVIHFENGITDGGVI